tara:strand:- start:516 stop:779 length:264 start_codon:yes stop_codon:yes gene_type:complete
MKKYKLYSTKSGWENKNSALEAYLGIPDGKGTLRYAEIAKVTNAENEDFGKYPMPAVASGTWACQDQFNASELVEGDPTWYGPSPTE